MPPLKCQTFLDNLRQKKYHFYNDEDIKNIIVNYDDKEWNALTCTKAILQFYVDNPDSGITHDDNLLDGEAMMQHYDILFYHVAKNKSKILSLSPSFAKWLYEDITRKEIYEDELSKHPFVRVIAAFYIVWVIILFLSPMSFWQTLLVAVLGGPEFILGLIFLFYVLQYVIIGTYDVYLICKNYLLLRKHNKSEYGKLEKKQADYLAARLAPSPNR